MTEIRRQKIQYREAVRNFPDILQGGFEKLNQWRDQEGMKGAVQPAPRDYADAVAGKLHWLFHRLMTEGEKVTTEIRKELMGRGKLARMSGRWSASLTKTWTEAQLSHCLALSPGMVVQFHQNAPGFTRGQKVTVSEVSSDGTVHVKDQEGRELKLPLIKSPVSGGLFIEKKKDVAGFVLGGGGGTC